VGGGGGEGGFPLVAAQGCVLAGWHPQLAGRIACDARRGGGWGGGYNGCQKTGGQNRQGSPMDLRSPGADGPLIYRDFLVHLRPGIEFSLDTRGLRFAIYVPWVTKPWEIIRIFLNLQGRISDYSPKQIGS
jgi:hypothetical protein